eukprot:4578624-Amphidinium_carterae.1
MGAHLAMASTETRKSLRIHKVPVPKNQGMTCNWKSLLEWVALDFAPCGGASDHKSGAAQ